MKYIQVGGHSARNGKIREPKFAMVDDADFEKLNKYKWTIDDGHHAGVIYARTNIRIYGKITKHYMHRMILNPAKGKLTDHIDGNGLNNQRSNLREATPHQNQCNKKSNANSKVKLKGVSVSKNKYIAQIGSKYKHRVIGRFDNELDAARAYNEAAIKYHGEFARLNILDQECLL